VQFGTLAPVHNTYSLFLFAIVITTFEKDKFYVPFMKIFEYGEYVMINWQWKPSASVKLFAQTNPLRIMGLCTSTHWKFGIFASLFLLYSVDGTMFSV